MCRSLWVFLINILIVKQYVAGFNLDKPCAARQINNSSVVCVCNATYCDTITRETPRKGSYYAYTSTESGLRFRKFTGLLQPKQRCENEPEKSVSILLYPKIQYQEINGFGSSVTDSAGINWKSVNQKLRQYLVNSYFGRSGLEYSMMRVPVGGTDFSRRPYAYNESPPNDITLSHFKLAPEDYDYKIPLIMECSKVAPMPLHIIATVWSPPTWMKTSDNLTIGFLKPIYYQTYADYYYKFIESYAAKGIQIWGITTTNEPLTGTLFGGKINTLQWTTDSMGEWIEKHLGPTIRNSVFKHVKIIAVDDQRFTIPIWFNALEFEHPGAFKYIDGVAVHFYFDQLTPASMLVETLKNYPDKFVISTEACEGVAGQTHVNLGSWQRGENYAIDIIEDLNNNVIGWIDWNMFLNEEGGPSWVKNYVDSPIIVSAEKQEFYKQPMFYVMGHFSKFVPRGSRRIKVTQTFRCVEIYHVAFITPENNVVVVIYNKGFRRIFNIIINSKMAVLYLEKKSITTVEFPCE